MSEAFTAAEDVDLLAAELALGLLDGEERAAAERREEEDAFFAARVGAWLERLEPMLGAAPERAPPQHLWTWIERRLGGAPAAEQPATNVIQLKRRVGIWRGYSAAVTAIAASLALVVGLDMAKPPAATPAPVASSAPEPLLVAALTPESGAVGATASFDRARGDLIIIPAALDLEAGRDPELWIVPKSGDPRSLGLVPAGRSSRIALDPQLAVMLSDSGTLAISSEPRGGSPTGLPTGPIVASGTLSQV